MSAEETLKAKVADASDMTLDYMLHLVTKGRGANPHEVMSLVNMVVNGTKPKRLELPTPINPVKRTKPKTNNEKVNSPIDPPPEPSPEEGD